MDYLEKVAPGDGFLAGDVSIADLAIAIPFGKCPRLVRKRFPGAQPGRHRDVMEQRTDIIKPKACRNRVVFLTTNNFSGMAGSP